MQGYPAEPKRSTRNRTLLIAAIVGAVGVLTLCLCVGLVSLTRFGSDSADRSAGADRYDGSSAPAGTDSSDGSDSYDGADNPDGAVVPAGGGSTQVNLSGSNTDARLRADVVQQLRAAIDTPGCPLSFDSAMVISEPDSSGEWIEMWDISNCNGSSTLTITFTPDETGTRFTVEGTAPGS